MEKDDYHRIGSEVALELEHTFHSNGLKHCKVKPVWDEDEGDMLVVDYLIKSILDVGAEQSPPANRTGLEGKCAICLCEKEKLFALNPCGHTMCGQCCGPFIGKQCPTCRQKVYGQQGVFPN